MQESVLNILRSFHLLIYFNTSILYFISHAVSRHNKTWTENSIKNQKPRALVSWFLEL